VFDSFWELVFLVEVDVRYVEQRSFYILLIRAPPVFLLASHHLFASFRPV